MILSTIVILKVRTDKRMCLREMYYSTRTFTNQVYDRIIFYTCILWQTVRDEIGRSRSNLLAYIADSIRKSLLFFFFIYRVRIFKTYVKRSC